MAIKKTLRDLISPIKKIIDTVRPLKGNKIITDRDRATESELNNLVNSSNLTVNVPPVINKNTLSPADANTLMNEEAVRRRLVAERRLDINQARLDEMERRELHKKQIQLQKDEFNLYLKDKYPLIVGQKQIRDGDERALKKDIERRKSECERIEIRLKDRIVDRLEREQLRKAQENSFIVNRVPIQQTFFEDAFRREYETKLKLNPEIDGLTDVQRTKKQISELEEKLGRKIIPHRDMMETKDGMVLIRERTTPNS